MPLDGLRILGLRIAVFISLFSYCVPVLWNYLACIRATVQIQCVGSILVRVTLVVLTITPFKISGYVVCLDGVFVVDLVAVIRAFAYKSSSDKGVDSEESTT